MPSPGIRFGDLMVFVAVLTVVALFLAFVRAFIRRVDAPDAPPEPGPRQPREARPPETQSPAPEDIGSPHSAVR